MAIPIVEFKNTIEQLGKFYNRNDAACFLSAIEALGLIKFDEPVRKIFTRSEAIKICRGAYNDTEDFIEGLEKHGYKIVPNG